MGNRGWVVVVGCYRAITSSGQQGSLRHQCTIASCPTAGSDTLACLVHMCRQQKREIDLLQRKIATLRRQAATAAAGGAAAAGEDSLQLAAAAVAAGDAWASDGSSAAAAGFRGLTSRSTKSAMERDKAIARLGLGVVEEYPRDVLIDLIQVRACVCVCVPVLLPSFLV